MGYSEKFRQSILQKVLRPGSSGISKIAEENGIHHDTIRRWLRLYKKETPLRSDNKKSSNRSPEEKLKIISESYCLSGNDLGEYLRKNGLHSSDLEEWKSLFFRSQKSPGRPSKNPEIESLIKREKALKKDLIRKDRALAEMSARVILLKKSQEIFGAKEVEE